MMEEKKTNEKYTDFHQRNCLNQSNYWNLRRFWVSHTLFFFVNQCVCVTLSYVKRYFRLAVIYIQSLVTLSGEEHFMCCSCFAYLQLHVRIVKIWTVGFNKIHNRQQHPHHNIDIISKRCLSACILHVLHVLGLIEKNNFLMGFMTMWPLASRASQHSC